jgi:hypothetical protein
MPFTLSTRTHGRPITEPSVTIPAPAIRRSWLAQLFAGEVEVSPFAPGCPSVPLVPSEAAAVARALGCPDLFLLDIGAAAARERVILHIAQAAAEHGERILILSPDPAAADRLAEALAAVRALRVVRALADDENPYRPSPAVTRLTSAAAGPNRAEQLRRDAARMIAALETTRTRLDRSREFHNKLNAITRERADVNDRVARLATEVRERHPSEGPAPRCTEIQGERATIQTRRKELEAIPAAKPGLITRLLGIGKANTDHSRELVQLADREAALIAECESITRRNAEEREALIASEIATLSLPLSARLAELDAESQQVERDLRDLLPRAASDDTVENGVAASSEHLERELAVARTRQQELAEAGADLPRRLLAETGIVVGTPGSVACDPVFEALDQPFDRLILDHAEELTETEFDRFAPLAARWILAGDAAAPAYPVANGRPRSRAAEATLLCRLARFLDREPWAIDGDRLIVRLMHLTPAQRAGLVREPVLDHPDVMLGVATLDGQPALAEIAFPAATLLPAAKSFLISQLGEVVLRTCGEPQWRRTDTAIVAFWPLFDSAGGDWIDVELAVRERVVGHGSAAFTAEVSFAVPDWDEAAAADWLSSRLSPGNGRVASLACERSPRSAKPYFGA